MPTKNGNGEEFD
jgi:hypothetical protein